MGFNKLYLLEPTGVELVGSNRASSFPYSSTELSIMQQAVSKNKIPPSMRLVLLECFYRVRIPINLIVHPKFQITVVNSKPTFTPAGKRRKCNLKGNTRFKTIEAE